MILDRHGQVAAVVEFQQVGRQPHFKGVFAGTVEITGKAHRRASARRQVDRSLGGVPAIDVQLDALLSSRLSAKVTHLGRDDCFLADSDEAILHPQLFDGHVFAAGLTQVDHRHCGRFAQPSAPFAEFANRRGAQIGRPGGASQVGEDIDLLARAVGTRAAPRSRPVPPGPGFRPGQLRPQ